MVKNEVSLDSFHLVDYHIFFLDFWRKIILPYNVEQKHATNVYLDSSTEIATIK